MEIFWLRIKLIGLLLLPFLIFFLPFNLVDSGPTICIYKNITGHNCYGCGITRAITAFIKGDAIKSIEYNPLVIIVFPVGLTVYFKELWTIFLKLDVAKL